MAGSRCRPVALHEQVAAAVRRAIADGEVGAGERMPPARDLAAVLGVNPNTVLRALRGLRDEGLLEFRRGRGITVTGLAPQRSAVIAKARELARRHGYQPQEVRRDPAPGVLGTAVRTLMVTARHDAGRAADPEALIREARRRQRRRRLAVTAAVAVAAGVVSAGVAVSGTGTGRPSPPPRSAHARHPAARQPDVPPIPRSVGATVLIWTYQNATWLEQPGTGRLYHSWKPDLAVGDYQPAMIPVGRWLVYVGDGASAIRDDLSGRPRELWTRAGGQTPFFAPAAQRGHVWLVFNERLRRHRPERARLVSVPAGRPGPARPSRCRRGISWSAGPTVACSPEPTTAWRCGTLARDWSPTAPGAASRPPRTGTPISAASCASTTS